MDKNTNKDKDYRHKTPTNTETHITLSTGSLRQTSEVNI